MQNQKKLAKTCLPIILLLFLILAPLITQTCSAKPIQAEENKAMSFLRDVIQLDVDHYKFTLTSNITNIRENTTDFSYKVEPKSFSFWNSFTMNFQFYNGTLTMFNVLPSGQSLVYTRSRPDRFTETLEILERYQAWLNDSQVGEMTNLMRQVGSEQSILTASGNLSLRIQQYSDVAEYRFSNYFNGVEYTSIDVSEGNRTGSVGFSDNRNYLKIGNTSVSISQDQAVAAAQNFIKAYPPRGNVPGETGIMNLNVTGVKGVNLKALQKDNDTLYPYYEVDFDIQQPTSGQQGYGVNVATNNGEVWGTYGYSSSTSTESSLSILSILVILLVAILACAAVIISIYKSRLRFNVRPDTA